MSFIVDPEDFSASKHAISGYTQLSRTYEKMGSDRNDLLNKKKAAVGKAKTELGQELTDLTWVAYVPIYGTLFTNIY